MHQWCTRTQTWRFAATRLAIHQHLELLFVEPLWSPAVADNGNVAQIAVTGQAKKCPQILAFRCRRLPIEVHGKEGVSGSSPEEGSTNSLQIAEFCSRRRQLPPCEGAGYEPEAVATFLQGADYYLVVHAHAYGHVVVTHEVVAHSTKRIKIPNACLAMSVKCMTPFEMLRTERARIVIGS